MKSYSLLLIKFLIAPLIFCLAVPAMARDSEIIGVWDHSSGKENYKIIIAEDDGDTVLIKKFDNGIMVKQIVIEDWRSDGVVYRPEDEDSGEYYLVDKAGDLQVRDESGLKETLRGDKKVSQ